MNDELTNYIDLVRQTFLEDTDVQGVLEDFSTAMTMLDQRVFRDDSEKNLCIELIKRECIDRIEHLHLMTIMRVDRHLEEEGPECMDAYKEERERRMFG